MPTPRRTPYRRADGEDPPDELVLAALERAARHEGRIATGVPLRILLSHLAIPSRTAAARRLRARLDVLQARGLLLRTQRHSVPMFALSRRGRDALSASSARSLPESPQHRAWRTARTAAREEVGRFRERLSRLLDEAAALLDADEPVASDHWFALAVDLQRACWRLGSATHCGWEWREPDEAAADVDELGAPGDELLAAAELARRERLRSARRNVRLWREGP